MLANNTNVDIYFFFLVKTAYKYLLKLPVLLLHM